MKLYNNIPDELKSEMRWICWRYEEDKSRKKPTKVPYMAAIGNDGTKYKASSTKAKNWRSYTAAVLHLENDFFDGIGFVFTGSQYSGIDIDGCIGEDGSLLDVAKDVLELLPASYTEKSVSGHGLHIIVKGKLPDGCDGFKVDALGLEVYSEKRYFTMSGDVYGDTRSIADGTEGLAILYKKYCPANKKKQSQDAKNTSSVIVHSDSSSCSLPEEKIIEIISSDKGSKDEERAAQLAALWRGDWSGYESQSQADQSLCNALAFWTVKDACMMDSIFRKSGLMRKKWDERHGAATYGQITIDAAINSCSVCYGDNIPASNKKQEKKTPRLLPYDNEFTDMGQAIVFTEFCDGCMLYTDERGYFVYTGSRWEASPAKAAAMWQNFSSEQLKYVKKFQAEADEELQKFMQAFTNEDGSVASMDLKQRDVLQKKKDAADALVTLSKKYRSANKQDAVLKLSRAKMNCDTSIFDSDAFLLNTPAGTVDLKTGQIHSHSKEDYITLMTSVAPDAALDGKLWDGFLNTITCGDIELKDFLQQLAGMAAVGKVFEEKLIIACGNGSNGKSTFFNTLMAVMGDYACTFSADVLVQSYGDKSEKLSMLDGKRLVVAGELGAGQRLDDATVKRMCSTDKVVAKRLYCSSYQFTPTHTAVLYTNNMPELEREDFGIIRRLVVIPFDANIQGDGQVKNYASYLVEHEGGAIMKWCIDGAVKFIANNFSLNIPAAVKSASRHYIENANKVRLFLADANITGEYAANTLFNMYLQWCDEQGMFPETQQKFGRMVSDFCCKKWRNKNGMMYQFENGESYS